MLFETFTTISNKLRGTGLGRSQAMQKTFSLLYGKLKPSDCTRLVQVENFSMLVDIRDMGDVGTSLRRKHVYHPQMTKVVREVVKSGMVCVDIGANIGYFTVIMSKLTGPSGSVYAFEPDSTNFDLLKRNLEINGCYNVIADMLAISSITGRTSLYTDKINFGGHSLVRKGRMVSDQIVPVTTLDHWMGSNKVDLVKIDVEGGESGVLSGMEGILKSNPNIILIIEYLPSMDSVRHLEELVDKGFRLWHINEFQKETQPITPFLIKKLWNKEVGMNILARRENGA